KGLDENMEAVQDNFLLRGFFNKKKKEEAKKLAELKKLDEINKRLELKRTDDEKKKNSSQPPVINKPDSSGH
ncbi:MAG TPA: hypothetical protein VI548_03600, partial [Chitinophagaceae bacterium]|nr:hypothetical protein [Chitinophagaceae bacterium]